MQMQKVSSNNIAAVGYDPDSMKLAVEFNTGATYEYQGVPQEEFDGLLSAGSVGSYFANNIKNSYSASRA